jgi:hypothetical protein
MKNLFIGIFLIHLCVSQTLAGTMGIGAFLGHPAGLSGKYFMRNHEAIDAAISYGNNELILYGDYLRHFPGAFGKQNAFVSSLSPYVGIGPIFAFSDGDKDNNKFIDDEEDFSFGGRIPVGVEWISKEIPVGLSLEIAPGMAIIPETEGFVQGGLAIRYYFK